MALTNAARVAITLKKVQGKSHTKTESELYNEPFNSGISLSSKTIFAECPSTNPNSALNSITDGVVEKVRFACEYIPGTDTIAGKHAFKLSLLPDYESTSVNPRKATDYYRNSATIAEAGGKLQLVPPQFGDNYIAKVYYGSIGEFTEISLTDKSCWNLDYFSGIFFQQDPPSDTSKNPTYIEAYLYVGEYLDSIISAIPSSPVTTLNLLSDVTVSEPINDQVLKYNSSSSQWEAQTLLNNSGETGATGEQGIQGETGAIGPQGEQGLAGPAGPKGDTGDLGNIGPQGVKGDTGLQGIQGIQGEVGPQGPSGVGGTGGVSGIERHIYEQVSGSVAAKTALTIPSMDINGAIPTLLDTQVYLNGQLLIGGTNTQLENDEVDYHFSSSTEIKLAFSTGTNDLIVVFRTQIGGTTLDELVGVSVDLATDNQVLTYNASTSQWEAQDPSIGCDIARYSYEHIGSPISAETDITIVDMDFTGITPTNTNTTLFLNGQLLVGGSISGVTTNAADYAFSNDTQVRFGSSIDDGDQIVIFHTTASFSTDKDFMLHTDDAAFNNARVITAGDGISISKATERQLIISNTAPPRTITELSNVYAPTPSNNQVLKYSSTTSQWEAQAESAGGGIERYAYEQTGSSVSAETDITIAGMDFTGITPTNSDTTLFLNGQLLVGGSTLDVTANTVDYAFNNDTQVRFGFEMSVGDAITIFHTTTSFATGKDFALHTDDTSFNNARVITAGDGISISKATPRQLIINNTGLIQRSKTHVTSATAYGTNDAFTVVGVDFSLKDYSDDRIDIFLNGTLLIKGTSYQLNDQETTLSSSQFKLIGSTSIGSGDIITTILF